MDAIVVISELGFHRHPRVWRVRGAQDRRGAKNGESERREPPAYVDVRSLFSQFDVEVDTLGADGLESVTCGGIEDRTSPSEHQWVVD